MSSNSNIFDLYNSNTGIFEFKDGNETKLYLDGTGKVGIGTTVPHYGLHVKSDDGSAGWVLKVESRNSTNDGVVLLGSRSDNDGAIQSLNNIGGASDLAINPDGGNVGIGTTGPHYGLHVKSDDGSAGWVLKVESRNSTNDGVVLLGSRSDNDGAIQSLNNIGGASDLAINPDGGNVGIGTTNPFGKFHIKDGTDKNIRITGENFGAAGGVLLNAFNDTNSQHIPMNLAASMFYFNSSVGIGTTNPGSYKLYVAGAAYSTGGWSSSDARWKKDIQPLENSLDNVLKLQGVSYLWRTEEFPQNGFTEGRQIGLIAQELEKVLPELVNTDKEGYKSVSYDKLTAILIEAVKEQQRQIVAQQEQINALKSEKNAKIASLENDIAELKEAMSSVVMLTSVK